MIAVLALWLALSVPAAMFAGRFIRAGMVELQRGHQAPEETP